MKKPFAIALLALVLGAPALAEPGPDPVEDSVLARDATVAEDTMLDPDATVADDSTHLEALAFPGVDYGDAVRLHFQSRFVPDADLGSGHASLYRPDLRGRVTVPVSERAVIRVSARGGMGRYEFRGPDLLLNDSLDLYQTHLAIQGAYWLNDDAWSLWRDDERWSLLASLQGGSDFESGAFSDGLGGGGDLALGFELPGTLRIAAGVSLSGSSGGGGVDVSPTGFLRWNVTDAVTLRNRGLGLQLEYRWSPRLELFVSGFRSTDRYALEGIGPTLDDLTLSDRMILTGAGFEWKISQMIRVNTEAGLVAWRRLRLRSDDLGTIDSRRGGPAAYFEIRFEVRP